MNASFSTEILVNARNFVFSQGSELTRQRWLHAFEGTSPAGILRALAAYQNPDGGFGHNLEGDFLLPDSSPMATSIAFQILSEIRAPANEPLVQGGMTYLAATYLPDRPGWLSVPRQVNDYAHADWWHFRPELGSTVIDLAWGNPSAELAGYLSLYSDLVPAELLEDLLNYTLNYFAAFSGKMDMHQLFCFLRFAELLPPDQAAALHPKLADLVHQEVCSDPGEWSGYCARPLDFVTNPESFLYPAMAEVVQMDLDYRIAALSPHGVAQVPWSWEDYPAEWQAVQPGIAARETFKTLVFLKEFGRI